MPYDENIRSSMDLLKSKHVIFENGLSDAEIVRTENQFGFKFPPDLKAFLQAALPVSIQSDWGRDAFPNWRSADKADLQRRLDWPSDGIAYDIEHNSFWMDAWGPKPDSLNDAIFVAREAINSVPKLIPIYSHRYLPAEPSLAGNPVFSVYQTDIIHYGCDLWDYFVNEFAPEDERWQRCQELSVDEYALAHRTIQFWSTFT